MAFDKLYPSPIPNKEREIIKGILSDRKDEIPSLWKLFTDKNNGININSYQNGFLIGVLYGHRKTVPEFWKQLIEIFNKIRKDAGVKETDLGNNMVELKDRSGFSITRQKYEWE